jgi:hypothetical protein
MVSFWSVIVCSNNSTLCLSSMAIFLVAFPCSSIALTLFVVTVLKRFTKFLFHYASSIIKTVIFKPEDVTVATISDC